MNHAEGEEVRRLLRADDPQALARLYDHLAAPLFAYLHTLLRQRQDAEEVLHDTFVAIARERQQVLRAENLSAYVYAMARNRAYSLGRTRQRQDVVSAGDDALLTVPAASSAPLGDAELRNTVNTALAALPPEQQAVVVLKIYQQHSFAEIGALLGLSLNTVASRYRYALAKLRHTLEEVRHG